MNETSQPALSVEQGCAGVTLVNRARRKDANRRRCDRAPRRARVATIDDAATRSNLVHIIVEAVGCHRHHLDDVPGAEGAASEWKRRACGCSPQLQHGIVWREQGLGLTRDRADFRTAQPLAFLVWGLGEAEPHVVARTAISELPGNTVPCGHRRRRTYERCRAPSRLTKA